MEPTDETWSKRVARLVGKQVAYHRQQVFTPDGKRLTVQDLADRCAALGLPLARPVISKIEQGFRQSVTVDQVMVLAKALNVAPIRLLFPMGLAETVEVLPGVQEDALDAAAWFGGEGDPDIKLLMLHRDLLKHSRGGQGPTPAGIWVGSMTDAEVKRWQQALQGEQVLILQRRSIREHGLVPPRLSADLAWIDDQQQVQRTMPATTTTEESVTEPATTPEPEPVVAAVVTSSLGVLICRRNDGRPPWAFISGKIEPRESPADAGVREVKEETGLDIVAGHEIGRRVHPVTGRTMVYMAAAPTHGTDVFVGDEDELAEVRWVGLAEADVLLPGLYAPVREYLAQVLQESAG